MGFKVTALGGLLIATAATAQMGSPGGGQGGTPGGGRGGPPGGGPPGEGRTAPPRPPKPLKRDRFDKAVTAMFRQADADRDGYITLDEVRTVIAGRRETIIRERFRRIDRNHNGTIEAGGFSAWQQGMGSVADSETQAAGSGGLVAEVIRPDLKDDMDDRLLARLIEPIGATVIVNADANSDGRTSLAELLAYEGRRFEAADTDHDGALTMMEMRGPDEPSTLRRPGGSFPDRPPR